MSTTKVKAGKEIAKLVDRFQNNLDVYKSSHYNETQVRREFIDPFFSALGWDIDNKQDFAEQYKEVIHEDAVKVGGITKAPDYSFRIGGVRKFFVEAKRPSVDIKGDVSPSYQLRRYGWSAGLPLSIVTDFEELSVFDCRIRPYPKDAVSAGRINYLHYKEYLDRFDEIYDVFSKEAILKGSFDRYAESSKGKRGTTEVDKEFLKEIEKWRELLAKNIALRNSSLSIEELNFSVQILIDRIIFLRICEDRGIETYETLKNIGNSEEIYPELYSYFLKADKKYNSGIFNFKTDKITPELTIDNKILKDILTSLYYPKSPYEFSVLGVEILGNVYEQFLGKVIRLTAGHQAKVETKPEVKKAGGVYYTPKYIVDYIVKNTVGKLIKNKTPKEIEKIKILDPACGSGSFLIGAYTGLLNYHLNWYLKNNPMRHKKSIFQAGQDKWILTTAEKKKILTNNIFGVDIDTQAVEVTKLSLLLKVLEDENRETLNQQMKLFQEQALPSLADNIKCGNSLIGPEFYDNQNLNLFEDNELKRINVFDWNDEKRGFGEIMKTGGFDVVIGNPPYTRIQTMKEWVPLEVENYKYIYHSAKSGNYDIYVIFIEKGYSLLKLDGLLGFILPHKFFQAQFGKGIRNFLSQESAVSHVIEFGQNQVFEKASTYTCLLFLEKKKSKKSFYWVGISGEITPKEAILKIEGKNTDPNIKTGRISSYELCKTEWSFNAGGEKDILEKIFSIGKPLSELTRKIFVGLQTSADKIYVLETVSAIGNRVRLFSKSLNKEVEIEKGLLKTFLMGKDVHRYESPIPKNHVIFPYHINNGKTELFTPKDIQGRYPLGWKYLLENKKALELRESGRFKGRDWYRYGRLNNLSEFNQQKIMTPEIALGCQMTYDSEGIYYHTTKVYSFLFNDKADESPKYYLAILNSPLLWFFLKNTGYVLRGGYFTFKTAYLNPFPMQTINFDNKKEKGQHDKMVTLVDQILDLHKKLYKTKLSQEKELYERQIKITDDQIDRLVYELYGLTESEIKLVESSNAK